MKTNEHELSIVLKKKKEKKKKRIYVDFIMEI